MLLNKGSTFNGKGSGWVHERGKTRTRCTGKHDAGDPGTQDIEAENDEAALSDEIACRNIFSVMGKVCRSYLDSNNLY